ncbi:MAG TPA: lipocalin family protein [Flavobacteriaceae bacterium]|nr:lipocalin family protein [Flavobacteriaceae bacterium]
MRSLYLFVACITLWGCQQQSPEDMKTHLSGYWEINNVQSEHIEEMDFTFSNTIDYIEVEDNAGVRTKLQPNIDGSFVGSKTAESFLLKVENDSLNMYYSTPFDEWKETVIRATKEELIVRNEEGIQYEYKKFKPFNLED